MYLAELIKEKDYIENSIYDLRDHILNLVVIKDKSDYKLTKSALEKRLEELDNLHDKYRQFSVSIERAKAKIILKVNDTELSLNDAITLKNSMENKLRSFEYILDNTTALGKEGGSILCIDVDDIFQKIEGIRLDIKTLESEIDFAIWTAEVK